MKKHSRRKGGISRWLARWRGKDSGRNLRRQHSLEALESRALLAADPLASVTALAGEGEEGDIVAIMPELQGASGTLTVGSSFNLRILVQDLRDDDPNPNTPADDRGVLVGSTDVTFNSDLAGAEMAAVLNNEAAQPFLNTNYNTLPQIRVTDGNVRVHATYDVIKLAQGSEIGPDQLVFATLPFKVGAVDDFATVNEESSNNSIDVLANDSRASGTLQFATTFIDDTTGFPVNVFGVSGALAESEIMFATTTGVNVSVPGAPSLTSVSDPANGTATISSGVVRYTPNAGFAGTDTFTYTITYPGGATDTGTATVTVTDSADPPNAANDTYTTNKDTVLNVPAATGVLDNDSDPDPGDQITVTANTNSARGVPVTVNGDGSFSYNPTGVAAFQALQAGQSLTDTFTYTISDKAISGNRRTDTATVTVTVTGAPVAPTGIDKVKFAQDLAAANVKFYGAAWCPHCTTQKQLFEDGQHFLPFIEVTNPDRTPNQIALDKNITTYPTWVFNEGTANEVRRTGVLSLEELSTLSGVEIPMGSDPFLQPIENVTLLAGAPLHIPLDGFDPNGTKLTYNVQVTGASGVTATLLPATRSMRIDMEGFGDMVFRLFDNEVPRVTNFIADLAEDGVYDGVIFHRIINNFVIQGGDPTGAGSGDPNISDFDDQFHFDLQHTQTGVLSMAKAGDDTNSSQFFITEVNPNNRRQLRSLDFNHSVFGILVEGEDVRAALSDVATNAQDRPITPPTMTSVDIFTDEENGVLRLKAPAGTTGTATVTVTATDMEGKTTTRTFNVTVQPDTFNGGPFLADIPPVRTTVNTPVTFQLQGRDVENDPVTYTAVLPQGANPTFQFNVNSTTGAVSVTPPQNFVGTLELLVGVRPQGTSDTGDTFDTQLVEIQVGGAAPTGIDLLAATDTGTSSEDNITNATQLQFQVSGVQNGATVQVFRGTQLVGTATATGSTVTVTTNNPSLLTEGTHQFTARQTVDGAQSDASSALSVTIDRTAPPAMTSTPPTEASVGNVFTYDAQNPQETTPGVFYSLVNSPTGMTINQSTGVVTWTPAATQTGQTAFKVRARDAAGNAVDQDVTLNVIAGPGRGDQYTTVEDTPLTVNAANGVLANDDPDNELGDPLTATRVTNAQNGNVTLNADGSFTYTPNANFQGTDSFTYRVSSGAEQGNVATVNITVTNTPDAPVAVNDSYTATEDQTLTVNQADGVQKNDQNLDGVTLTSVVVAGPTNGNLTLNANGSFSYTPNANFSGTDSFTYRLNSSSGQSNVATVSLTVTGQNDPPTAVNDTYTTVEDTPLTVNAANGVLKNDTDPENATLVSLLVAQPQNGTLNFNAQTGAFTYTPNANFTGADTFTYRANDNNSNSTNVATVTINVTAQNDPPTIQSLTFTSFKNAPRTFFPLTDFSNRISDPDGAGQTFRVTAVANSNQGGTVEVGPNGTGFFYTPAANFTGTETFSITIADQGNATATATATFTVHEFKPGSIAGFVYLDHNNNGVMDEGEGRVAGVTVTLNGTPTGGSAITARTAVTAADGSYKFDNIQPGQYTVTQTQPSILVDGKETPGSQGGTSSTNDQIAITLAEGVDGTGNNFGEMRPAASFSILDFLFVKHDSVLVSANNSADAEFYVVESGWENLNRINARLNTANTAATLTIEEPDGDDLQVQNVSQFQNLTANGTRSLLRFFGDRTDYSFQPVTSSTQSSLTQDESQNGAEQDSSQDDDEDQGEGEPEDDSLAASEFLASAHEFSIRDFLFTADASAASTLSRPPAADAAPQLAQAVDQVLAEMAEGEGEDAAPVYDVAAASLADEDEFHSAVDQVFQEDAAL